MYGQLIPCGGGESIPLRLARLVVGRKPECDVCLPFATISSKHCMLEFRDGQWYVSDLGSRNGVRIDGVKCESGVIPPGMVVAIAQYRFEIDYVPSLAKLPISAPQQQASSDVRSPSAASAPMRRGIGGPSASPAASNPLPSKGAAEPSNQPKLPASPIQTVNRAGSLGELIPCGGGAPIRLTKPKLLVGRLPNCDVSIPHPMVSGKHCELEFIEGFWRIRDLQSRNGFRVNEYRETEKYLLPGDIVTIAQVRFEISYIPQGTEPPPLENPFGMSLLEKAGLAGGGEKRLPPVNPHDLDQKKRWNISAE